MKKAIFSVLGLLAVIALSISCQQGIMPMPPMIPQVHAHTYDDEWSSDTDYHWHAATCGHNVVADKTAHTWEQIIDTTGGKTTSINVCTICGYADESSRIEYTGNVCTFDTGTGYTSISDAITAFNSMGNGEYVLTILNGTYDVSGMTIQQVENKKLTVKAETPYGVTLKNTSDSDEYIFYIDSNSGYRENADILFSGINFDVSDSTEAKDVSAAIYLGTGNNDRYTQNVTVENCNFVGNTNNCYAVYCGNSGSGAKNVTVKNCNGDSLKGIWGGNVTNLLIEDCEFTNMESLVNSGSENTQAFNEGEPYLVTIRNLTAEVRLDEPHDNYGIRMNGGKLLVEDSNLSFSYNYSEGSYGLIVFRYKNNVADIKNSRLSVETAEGSEPGYVFFGERLISGSSVQINVDSSSIMEADGYIYGGQLKGNNTTI